MFLFEFSSFWRKMNVTYARNCLFMFKSNLQIKNQPEKNIFGALNQCKQTIWHRPCLQNKEC